MYLTNFCKHRGCTHLALSKIEQGKLIESGDYCLEHTHDSARAAHDILCYIQEHDKIVGLNACGIEFSTDGNFDLSNKRFYGCNFMHCIFRGFNSRKMRSRMTTFDFSIFSDCNLLESNMQFTSFAGCKFVHVLFTGSEMIQNNFEGLESFQSSFDDSDLYNSRFIKAMLINTSMNNCNLKKTVFYESMREGVGFKLSNTRESLLDRNKGGLMGDFGIQYQDMDDVLMPRNEDEQKEVFL